MADYRFHRLLPSRKEIKEIESEIETEIGGEPGKNRKRIGYKFICVEKKCIKYIGKIEERDRDRSREKLKQIERVRERQSYMRRERVY